MAFEEPPFIVKIGENHKLNLDETVLEQILDKSKPPFVILSVIGSPGSGKSFFLNYILRYLKAKGDRNWIGNKETPLDGFPWNQSADDEDESREGIRIFHEVVNISEDGEDVNLRVLLLDIDYFKKEGFESNYAALEAFCLSVSNDVIYVDSFQNHEINERIECCLEQLLSHLLPTSSNLQLKFMLNSTLPASQELLNESLPLVLKPFRLVKLGNCKYFSDLPISFKGESKYIQSLTSLKSIVISSFPVNEILALLSSASKHYENPQDLICKFKSMLNEINNLIPVVLVQDTFNKYKARAVERPPELLSEESSVAKYAETISSTEEQVPIPKQVQDINDENINTQRYLEESETEFPLTTISTYQKNEFENISHDLETKNRSPSIANPQTLELSNTQTISSKNSDKRQKSQSFQHIIDNNFNEQLRKAIQANLKYFVRDDARSKLTRVFKNHFSQVISKYSGSSTGKIAEQIQDASNEYIKTLKPLLLIIEKFVNMMENEFDSELYLDEDQLESQLKKAHSFAVARYRRGENDVLDCMLEKCLQACEQNYMERNGFVRDAELKLMDETIHEIVKFFKKELMFKISADNPETHEKLKEQRENLSDRVTAMLVKANLHSERTRMKVQEVVHREFHEITQLHHNNYIKIEKFHAQIIDDCLTSYEEQIRVYFERPDNANALESSHIDIKETVIKRFKEVTRKTKFSAEFEARLRTNIDTSFVELKRQFGRETISKNMNNKPHVEDTANKIQNVETDSKFQATIGIHFGRSKIRSVTFRDNKFRQIKISGNSPVLPNYIGISTENRIILGEDAKRRFNYNPEHALKISNMRVGQKYQIRGNFEHVVDICLEESVAIVLKHIYSAAALQLNCDIKKSVITVPSLSDHAYRQSMLDAAELAGIENVHIISECSGATSKYIQKFPSDYGSMASVLVAYHTGSDDLEAGYFNVNSYSSRQKSISGKDYDKPEDWMVTVIRWYKSIKLTFWTTEENPKFTGIVKNALHGANTKELDTIVCVSDAVKGRLLAVKECQKSVNPIVDLAEGVVEGSGYYAHSLTTRKPIFLQECLPYELRYEYLDKSSVAFNQFTAYPEETVFSLSYNVEIQREVRIKLIAYYSKQLTYTVETVSLPILNASKFDMVEFGLKLDIQGILSVEAELVESSNRKNRKKATGNLKFDNNLTFLEKEYRKDNVGELYQSFET